MKRMFGMMPSADVELEKSYRDRNGLRVTIQAGPKGWTIIWADGGTTYKDVEATTEENFAEAKAEADSHMELFEDTTPKSYDVVEAGECAEETEDCWEG